MSKFTDDDIKEMVNRFLSWKLPEDFNPDRGISFQRTFKGLNGPMKHEPVGTNLFTATQAEAMIRYIVGQTDNERKQA